METAISETFEGGGTGPSKASAEHCLPPWWLRGGHRQTLFAGLAKRFAPEIAYRRERWVAPDGDFIELDWVQSTFAQSESDLYVAFHGLQSNSRAGHLRWLMSAVERLGQRGVVVHFRGCSGIPNRRPRAYHSADSDEIDWILRRLRAENPKRQIHVIGYSLGGAALLKWLTEPHREAECVITKAVAVSAPLDLSDAATAVSHGSGRVYSWIFVRSLRPVALRLLERFPELERRLDRKRIERMRTLLEFDELVTAPLHGFNNLQAYHEGGSTKRHLHRIRVPTLIVTAKDDPIARDRTTEELMLSNTVRIDRQQHGGHAAFYRKADGRLSSWIPQRVMRFFNGAAVASTPEPMPVMNRSTLGLREWLGVVLAPLGERAMLYLLRSPRLHRFLAERVRSRAPVLRLGSATFVTGARYVYEVLNRDDDFLLGPVNQHQVLVGDFLLSLDPGPQYLGERALLQRAFPPNRIARIERMTDKLARRFVGRARRTGSLDAVQYAERLTVALAKFFWGLNGARASSKCFDAADGAETMRLWLRYLGAAIATPSNSESAAMRLAHACRDEFVTFVQDATQSPRQRGVLRCLVCLAPNPSFAWRNAAGLIVTASVVVTKAFINALRHILSRDEIRAQAIALAKAGDKQKLAAIVVEALRFDPVFPFLARYVPRDTNILLDDGTPIAIPAGSTVVLSALAAMFDPLAVSDPQTFQAGRDLRLNPRWVDRSGKYGCPHATEQRTYFHFSSGTHECPADQLAIAEITAMLQALLASEPRLDGALRYDGVAADKLMLRWDA